MGARQLVAVLVAVVALAGLLGWALGRSGDRQGTSTPRGPEAVGYQSGGAGAAARSPGVSPVGPAMMGSGAYPGTSPVRNLGEAKRQAQSFADQLGLRVGELIQFENHYYVELLGHGGERATEVLVDPITGAVWPEYGPAMMWNARYGMMGDTRYAMMGGSRMHGPGGMMGGGYGYGPNPLEPGPDGGAGWQPAISAKGAEEIARRWLRENRRGLRAGEAEEFPGYYTLDVLRAGRMVGMLSVDAFTGAVWYHWWHGRFVRKEA